MTCSKTDALKKLRDAGVSKEALDIVKENFGKLSEMAAEDLRMGDDFDFKSITELQQERDADAYEASKENMISYLNAQKPRIQHPLRLKKAVTNADRTAVPYSTPIAITSFSETKGLKYKFLGTDGKPQGKEYSIAASNTAVKLDQSDIESEFSKHGFDIITPKRYDKVLSNDGLDIIKKITKECM